MPVVGENGRVRWGGVGWGGVRWVEGHVGILWSDLVKELHNSKYMGNPDLLI